MQSNRAADRRSIQSAIDDLRTANRAKKLAGMRVVGATLASAGSSALDKQRFPLVFLDECSQIIEPSSLLAVGRFHCERLLAVGDPKQLPPPLETVPPPAPVPPPQPSQSTVATATQMAGDGDAGASLSSYHTTDHTLSKTLFMRLCGCGLAPILLRMQYRCHPTISRMPNQLFYENKLLDGIAAVDRAPVVLPHDAPSSVVAAASAAAPASNPAVFTLSPLVFYDVSGKQGFANGSLFNETEIKITVTLISDLLAKGVRSFTPSI